MTPSAPGRSRLLVEVAVATAVIAAGVVIALRAGRDERPAPRPAPSPSPAAARLERGSYGAFEDKPHHLLLMWTEVRNLSGPVTVRSLALLPGIGMTPVGVGVIPGMTDVGRWDAARWVAALSAPGKTAVELDPGLSYLAVRVRVDCDAVTVVTGLAVGIDVNGVPTTEVLETDPRFSDDNLAWEPRVFCGKARPFGVVGPDTARWTPSPEPLGLGDLAGGGLYLARDVGVRRS